MDDARHDQAVALLTGLDRSIKLVVYRERIVPKGEKSEAPPPGSQRIPKITQPVINWQQSSTSPVRTPSPVGAQPQTRPLHSPGGSLSYHPQSPVSSPVQTASRTSNTASGPSPAATFSSSHSPGHMSSGIETSPTVKEVTPASPFSSAVPTSYSYLVQPAAPTLTLPGQPSPSPVSPKFGARTLSSEWATQPTSVQPPKFVYPGYNKTSPSLSSTPSTTTTISLSTSPSLSAPASTSAPEQALSPSTRTSMSLSPSQTLSVSPVVLQVTRTSPGSGAASSATASHLRGAGDAVSGLRGFVLPTITQETPDESPDSNHLDLRESSLSPQPYPVEVSICVSVALSCYSCTHHFVSILCTHH